MLVASDRVLGVDGLSLLFVRSFSPFIKLIICLSFTPPSPSLLLSPPPSPRLPFGVLGEAAERGVGVTPARGVFVSFLGVLVVREVVGGGGAEAGRLGGAEAERERVLGVFLLEDEEEWGREGEDVTLGLLGALCSLAPFGVVSDFFAFSALTFFSLSSFLSSFLSSLSLLFTFILAFLGAFGESASMSRSGSPFLDLRGEEERWERGLEERGRGI